MAKEAAGAGESMKLQIKFGGETISMAVPPESTLDELKSSLQASTNVLPRGQKLIYKGFFFSRLALSSLTLCSRR